MQSCILQHLLCFESSISRCLLFHEPHESHALEIRTLCGVINTGQQLMSQTWYIIVPSHFSLYINFKHFLLPSSPYCKFEPTVSVETTAYNSKQILYTYCGHRMPWYLSFPQSYATVNCNVKYNPPKGFHFVLTFQAFDIAVASVALKRLTEYETDLTEYDTDLGEHKDDTQKSRIFTLAFLALDQNHNFIGTEIQLLITVPYLYSINLQSSPMLFSQMKIYNGPGILSLNIMTGSNTTRLSLSSYLGYIVYFALLHGNKVNAYYDINNCSYTNSSVLKWSGIVLESYENCSDIQSFPHYQVRQATPVKICQHIIHGVITINQLTFAGFNMLRHSPSDIFSMCQYGGLFVSKIDYHDKPSDEYFKICSNVTDTKTIPIHYSVGELNAIVFITFPGYSSGMVDLTFKQDFFCFGQTTSISRGPSCSEYWNTWYDYDTPFPTGVNNSNWKHIQCNDVWLMNDIAVYESIPYENCSFALDHSKLAFPVGPFKMITSSSFIPRSTFTMTTSKESPLGELSIEMDILKNFPISTSTRKINISVPLMTEKTNTFNFSTYTVFKTKYSGNDQFPMFAIRIQFIEHSICSPNNYDRLSYDTLYSKIYTTDENTLDIYLLRDHPYNELSEYLQYYAGYNRGTCRVLIPGHNCSKLISHHEIIRIHYYPHGSLVLPLEIDISMKKTINCSIKCTLDIGILEFMHINNTRRSRYHEWIGIYRLTWRIIAAKSRGFSVMINSTCDSCTKLCDIAVALGLPTTNYPVLFNATTIYDNYLDALYNISKSFRALWITYENFEWAISNLRKPQLSMVSIDYVYGSWYDAHTYCSAKNASLITLTPTLYGQLKALDDQGYGWKSTREYFFTGLHHADSVGTS